MGHKLQRTEVVGGKQMNITTNLHVLDHILEGGGGHCENFAYMKLEHDLL